MEIRPCRPPGSHGDGPPCMDGMTDAPNMGHGKEVTRRPGLLAAFPVGVGEPDNEGVRPGVAFPRAVRVGDAPVDGPPVSRVAVTGLAETGPRPVAAPFPGLRPSRPVGPSPMAGRERPGGPTALLGAGRPRRRPARRPLLGGHRPQTPAAGAGRTGPS